MGNDWSNIGYGNDESTAMDSALAYITAQGYIITNIAIAHPLYPDQNHLKKYFVQIDINNIIFKFLITNGGWYQINFQEIPLLNNKNKCVCCSLQPISVYKSNHEQKGFNLKIDTKKYILEIKPYKIKKKS